MNRLFLLSPANLSGRRAQMLLQPSASFELATRLRLGSVPLGDAFSFISALYFRGKLAYANAFSRSATPEESSVLIITATRGLLSPGICVDQEQLNEMAGVPIRSSDPRYRVPLEQHATRLATQPRSIDEVVLLGSIATSKYVEPLWNIFGERLVVPSSFIGRGDMSRGSLLLRAVRSQTELEYVPVGQFPRSGARKRQRN